jgi:predicted nucleic acid-binding protein
MAASITFVFDASPLIASCQFAMGQRSVADIVLSGATVQIPPAVYEEVSTRGGTRPDALKAAGLVNVGRIQVADVTAVGEELADLQHYQLGQGEREALTLTTRLGDDVVMVTDDFLALIVANRLGLSWPLVSGFRYWTGCLWRTRCS